MPAPSRQREVRYRIANSVTAAARGEREIKGLAAGRGRFPLAAVTEVMASITVMPEAGDKIRINRAPVLTLWAAVVAERLGFDHDTALTLGQAVAGLSAYAKGVSLGIIEPRPERVHEQSERLTEGEQLRVDLLGLAVPVVRTPDGLRAVNKGRPGNPVQIAMYLAAKFGDRLDDATQAMARLAAACEPADLY